MDQFLPGDIAIMVLRFLASSGCEESVMTMIKELPMLQYYAPSQPPGMSKSDYVKLLARPTLAPGLSDVLNDYAKSKLLVAETFQQQHPTGSPPQQCDSLVTQMKKLINRWEEQKNTSSNSMLQGRAEVSDAAINTDNVEEQDVEKQKTSVKDTSVTAETQTEDMEFGDETSADEGDSRVAPPLMFYNTLIADSSLPEKLANVINATLKEPSISLNDAVQKASSQTESEIDKFLTELLQDEDKGNLPPKVGSETAELHVDEGLSNLFSDADSLINSDFGIPAPKVAVAVAADNKDQVLNQNPVQPEVQNVTGSSSDTGITVPLVESAGSIHKNPENIVAPSPSHEFEQTASTSDTLKAPVKRIIPKPAPVVVSKNPIFFSEEEGNIVEKVNPPGGRPYTIQQTKLVRKVSNWEKLGRRSIEPKIQKSPVITIEINKDLDSSTSKTAENTATVTPPTPLPLGHMPQITSLRSGSIDGNNSQSSCQPSSKQSQPINSVPANSPAVELGSEVIESGSTTKSDLPVLHHVPELIRVGNTLKFRNSASNNDMQKQQEVRCTEKVVSVSIAGEVPTSSNKRKAKFSTPVKLTPEKAKASQFFHAVSDQSSSKPLPSLNSTPQAAKIEGTGMPKLMLVTSPISPVKYVYACSTNDIEQANTTNTTSKPDPPYQTPSERTNEISLALNNSEVTPVLDNYIEQGNVANSSSSSLIRSPRLNPLIRSAQKILAVSSQALIHRKSYSTPRKKKYVRNLDQAFMTPPCKNKCQKDLWPTSMEDSDGTKTSFFDRKRKLPEDEVEEQADKELVTPARKRQTVSSEPHIYKSDAFPDRKFDSLLQGMMIPSNPVTKLAETPQRSMIPKSQQLPDIPEIAEDSSGLEPGELPSDDSTVNEPSFEQTDPVNHAPEECATTTSVKENELIAVITDLIANKGDNKVQNHEAGEIENSDAQSRPNFLCTSNGVSRESDEHLVKLPSQSNEGAASDNARSKRKTSSSSERSVKEKDKNMPEKIGSSKRPSLTDLFGSDVSDASNDEDERSFKRSRTSTKTSHTTHRPRNSPDKKRSSRYSPDRDRRKARYSPERRRYSRGEDKRSKSSPERRKSSSSSSSSKTGNERKSDSSRSNRSMAAPATSVRKSPSKPSKNTSSSSRSRREGEKSNARKEITSPSNFQRRRSTDDKSPHATEGKNSKTPPTPSGTGTRNYKSRKADVRAAQAVADAAVALGRPSTSPRKDPKLFQGSKLSCLPPARQTDANKQEDSLNASPMKQIILPISRASNETLGTNSMQITYPSDVITIHAVDITAATPVKTSSTPALPTFQIVPAPDGFLPPDPTPTKNTSFAAVLEPSNNYYSNTNYSLITPMKTSVPTISPPSLSFLPPTPRFIPPDSENDSNSNSNFGGFRPLEDVLHSNIITTPFKGGPPPTPGRTIFLSERSQGLSLTVARPQSGGGSHSHSQSAQPTIQVASAAVPEIPLHSSSMKEPIPAVKITNSQIKDKGANNMSHSTETNCAESIPPPTPKTKAVQRGKGKTAKKSPVVPPPNENVTPTSSNVLQQESAAPDVAYLTIGSQKVCIMKSQDVTNSFQFQLQPAIFANPITESPTVTASIANANTVQPEMVPKPKSNPTGPCDAKAAGSALQRLLQKTDMSTFLKQFVHRSAPS